MNCMRWLCECTTRLYERIKLVLRILIKAGCFHFFVQRLFSCHIFKFRIPDMPSLLNKGYTAVLAWNIEDRAGRVGCLTPDPLDHSHISNASRMYVGLMFAFAAVYGVKLAVPTRSQTSFQYRRGRKSHHDRNTTLHFHAL